MSVRRVAISLAMMGGGFALGRSADAQSIPLTQTALASGAIITRDQGIDFVTIGSPGNAPWVGAGSASGRGSVSYEYRIGRFEVTTAQWAEFFNAALDRPAADRIPFITAPATWGAVGATPQNPGGQRFAVPAGNEMRPVGDITWRMAAIYCNWLCNDKRTERAAFMNGAYDVSTFGYTGNIFTDQLTHNPSARYWIPTWDEWIKAAHYDPNRSGPGQGAYWNYSTTTDEAPIYGPPGIQGGVAAQVNGCWSSLQFPNANPFAIPLGAYPTVQSPWGLLDVAGGTTEWTDSVVIGSSSVRYRVLDGSYRSSSGGSFVGDMVSFETGLEFPSIGIRDYGFRIASSVPSPSGAGVAAVSGVSIAMRRRRKQV